MCVQPIRIQNKGLRHNPGQYLIDVPCGCCKECQDVKSTDYFLRAFAIFRTLPSNWSCFFCTFTYNNENVPKTDFYVPGDSVGSYVCVLRDQLCFNHEHIHTAMKSLTQYYRRKFPNDYVLKLRSDGKERKIFTKVPKYLVTSEFGETTLRPHYHAIIFIPESISFLQFKELIEKFWHYGFTKNIKLHKLKMFTNARSDENCIKYVTKYVTKFSGFFPSWLLHREYIPSLGDWFQVEPRIFTSNGFGSELEKIITDANYEQNKITLAVAGKYQSYCIPSYYRRRKYTKSVVDFSESYKVGYSYPFRVVRSKTLYRKVQHTEYLNNYLDLKKDALSKDLRVKWFKCLRLFEDKDFLSFCDKYFPQAYDIYHKEAVPSPTGFVSQFFLYSWSNTPVYTYDYEITSVPTFDLIRPESRITYSVCQLCENGVGNKDMHYERIISDYKNLSTRINVISLRGKSNLLYNDTSNNRSVHLGISRFFELLFLLDVSQIYSRLHRGNVQEKKIMDEYDFYSKSC